MSPHSVSPQSYSGEPFNVWLANEISETKGHVIAQGEQLLHLDHRLTKTERRHEEEDAAKAAIVKVRRDRRWDVAKSVALVLLTALLTLLVGCLLRSF